MKKISLITIVFWIFFLFGYFFAPEVFKQDRVQFPLVLLLSVLLPVSFWQVANNKGKRKYLALFFIAIFVVNITFLSVVMRDSFTLQQQVSEKLNIGIQPKFAEYPVTAVSAHKRQLAARLIYQQHGIALPFKDASGAYTVYEPTEIDKGKFKKNFFAINDLKMKKGELAASFFTAALLLMTHAGLFLALLTLLILYDKDRRKEDGRMEL